MSGNNIRYKGETITTTMSRLRDAHFEEEVQRADMLTRQGHSHPEVTAHIDAIFGEQNPKPSTTPRVNFGFGK